MMENLLIKEGGRSASRVGRNTKMLIEETHLLHMTVGTTYKLAVVQDAIDIFYLDIVTHFEVPETLW